MTLFEFIRTNSSILDVVADYVQLRHAGTYWKGSCPFHSETDASFTISPERQIFYCFGCQASGDVVGFMAKIEHLSQIEAAQHIINRYKILVPEAILRANGGGIKANTEEKEVYYNICKEVALWTHQSLLTTPDAFSYITARSVTPELIKNFAVGYFPGGTTAVNLFVQAMARKGILLKELLEYGIVMEGKAFLFSPFEERIMFPIKDLLGRYAGFGGRVFRPNDQRAKYYNSRESEGFSKGKLLFGLDSAKKAIQTESAVFLVEGYMDCIAMVQYGFANTVATLGTACTPDHLKTLARYAQTLYVAYDGDQAGQKAMIRLTELCWEVSIEPKVIILPKGDDPASYIARQADMRALFTQARDIFSFYLETTLGGFNQKTLSEKLACGEKVTAMIAKLKDPFKQDLLLQQASGCMDIPIQSLKQLLRRQRFKLANKQEYAAAIAQGQPQTLEVRQQAEEQMPLEAALATVGVTLEESIISAIINTLETEMPYKIDADLIPHFQEQLQSVIKKSATFTQTPYKQTFGAFLDLLDERERSIVPRMSVQYQPIAREHFDRLVLQFCKRHWKQIVKTIKDEIVSAKQHNDIKRLD
ncbi:MAG: DNA primase, partial [Candidatus Babeliales bacterium]